MKKIFFVLLGIAILSAAATFGASYMGWDITLSLYYSTVVCGILWSAFTLMWIFIYCHNKRKNNEKPADVFTILPFGVAGIILCGGGTLIYNCCPGAPHQMTMLLMGVAALTMFFIVMITGLLVSYLERLIKKSQAPKKANA